MRTRWIIAAILVVVGAVWIGQGLGLIRSSSFMTDDIRWALVGGGLIIAGLVVGASAVRARPNP
ncbi:MAG: hypothetical protein E4H24_06620 [Thermomicrobiales bacterium]|jgi:hypothetical protein|nr:MAG: hypothetical protein E4H24_06620 [Thermomicrobiales bacterium]